MPATVFQFPATMLSEITVDGDAVTLGFSPAFLQKSEGIAGVDASTRWRVDAKLVLREATLSGPQPALPVEVESGRIRLNQFTYVDLAPMPMDGPGAIRIELTLSGHDEPIVVDAGSLNYLPAGLETYIEHI